MDRVKRWYLRLAAALAALVAVWLLPAAAWAADGPVGELARRRVRTRGLFGGVGSFAGACCCLLVVLMVALIVIFLRRRRQPPEPPR